MSRRALLIFGLILLGFALLGVLMLPQGGLRIDTQTDSILLPGRLTPMPEPRIVTLGGDGSFAANIIAAPPLLMLAALFSITGLAVGVALAAARRRALLLWLRGPAGRAIGASMIVVPAGLGLVIVLLGGCQALSTLLSASRMASPTMTIPQALTFTYREAGDPTLAPSPPPGSPPPSPTLAPPSPTAVRKPIQPLELRMQWPGQMDPADTPGVVASTEYPFDLDWLSRLGPLPNPLWPGYTQTLEMTLTGDGFIVTPDSQHSGPYDFDPRYGLTWQWRIHADPGVYGPRLLHLTLTGRWDPIDAAQGQPFEQVLARRDLLVNVAAPIAPPATLRIASLLAALIGAGLCVPWLYALFRSGAAQ